jgi:WD40 repeat protein
MPLYEAFISYRHIDPDQAQAIWLHRALETYRTPKPVAKSGGRRRLGKVFRDKEELRGGPNVSEAVLAELRESKHLIVVCSPRSAQSKWVNDEITYFQQLGRGDRILTLLIEGEPIQAFPRALLARDEAGEVIEPLAADIRPLPPKSRPPAPWWFRSFVLWTLQLFGQKRAFAARRRLALLRLLAPMLDCRFDELRRRDRERTKRRQRALGITVASIVLIGGLLVRNSTERQIFELTAYSRDSVGIDPSRSVLLSRLAFGESRRFFGLGGPLVRNSLELAVFASRLRAQYQMPASPVQAVAWHGSGVIAAGDDAGNVRVWNRVTSKVLIQRSFTAGIQKIEFRPLRSRVQAAVLTGSVNRLPGTGITILHQGVGRSLELWDLQSNATNSYMLSPAGQYHVGTSDVSWCDPDHIAASDGLETVFVWDLQKGSTRTIKSADWGDVNAIKWTPGCGVLNVGTHGGLYQWDAATGATVRGGPRCTQVASDTINAGLTMAEGVVAIDVISVFKDGLADPVNMIATGGHTGVVCVGNEYAQPLSGHTDTVTAVAWSHGGTRLATASLDGTVRIWTLFPNQQFYRTEIGFHTNQEQCWSLAWSPDDRELATAGAGGTVKVWSVERRLEETIGGERGVLDLDSENRLLFNQRRITAKELDQLAANRSVRRLTQAECESYLHRSSCP